MQTQFDPNQCESQYSFQQIYDFTQQQLILSHHSSICQFQNISEIHQTQSPYYKQYSNYFKHIQPQVDTQIFNCLQDSHRRLQYKLVLLKQDSKLLSFQKPLIHLKGSQYKGSIMLYEVVIGNYKLQISLLNLNIDAPKNIKQLGSGGYGSVYQINYAKNKFKVSKRIIFKYHQTILKLNQQIQKIRPNPYDLNEIITQYCIYKICSFYKIGPSILPSLGFDLVCFIDSAEFYMQPCIQLSGNYDQLEQQLKLNLCLLHKLKIIHKDIKSSNILYSPIYKRFILADFGISHPIKQEIGKLTKTYKQGTIEFMSKQMKAIKQHTTQFIDLYYNDLFGLIVSLGKIKKMTIRRPLRPKLRNQSNKFSQQYFQIYFLGNLYTKNKAKMVQILQISHEQKILIKSPIISTQFNDLYQMVYDIINQKQFDINIFDVFTIQDPEDLYLEFLIRCNGLSKKLEYQLNKLSFTNQLIQKISNQISMQQYQIPLINVQVLQLMKYNEQESFLIRNIHNLEFQRDKHKKYINEYNRQIFKNLYCLYNIIIIKPAKYIHSLLKILDKLYQYQYTKQQKIKFSMSVTIKQIRFGVPIQYFKPIIEQIKKYHPQYLVELLEGLIVFAPDKKTKLILNNICLVEYLKNQNKYFLKILSALNNISLLYIQIGQIQNGNQFFKKIQQKIQKYKRIAPKNKLHDVIMFEMVFLGDVHKQSENYNIALQCYQNYVHKYIEQKGFQYQQIAMWYYQIGNCYFCLKRYQQAQSNFLKAMDWIDFFDENYSDDNFIQLCITQLIIINFLSNKIEKAENYMKKLFFKNELSRVHNKNKYLQYDEDVGDYVIHSMQQLILQQLKLILDQKTNAFFTSLHQLQQVCIQQIMIFRQQLYRFLNKRSYFINIQKHLQINKINNKNLIFLQLYIQFNNNYLLKSMQTIVNQYLAQQKNFNTLNLILVQLLKQFYQFTSIDSRIPLNFYKFQFERQYNLNNKDPTLAIIYLKFEYELLKKDYSYQFINCAYRLSIRLFKKREYWQCIYYTMQMLKILQKVECQENKKIYQLYRRIFNCHICLKDSRLKKLQYLKQKQMKNLKKKGRKICQQWMKFYLSINYIQRFIIINYYLKSKFKTNIDIDKPKKLYNKFKKYDQISQNIFNYYNKEHNTIESKLKNIKYHKLYLKIQLKHDLSRNKLSGEMQHKIKKQILILNRM